MIFNKKAQICLLLGVLMAVQLAALHMESAEASNNFFKDLFGKKDAKDAAKDKAKDSADSGKCPDHCKKDDDMEKLKSLVNCVRQQMENLFDTKWKPSKECCDQQLFQIHPQCKNSDKKSKGDKKGSDSKSSDSSDDSGDNKNNTLSSKSIGAAIMGALGVSQLDKKVSQGGSSNEQQSNAGGASSQQGQGQQGSSGLTISSGSGGDKDMPKSIVIKQIVGTNTSGGSGSGSGGSGASGQQSGGSGSQASGSGQASGSSQTNAPSGGGSSGSGAGGVFTPVASATSG